MTDLHDIQRQIVARITSAPTGSALKFALMDAADAVSRAIEAEKRARGRRPITEDEIMAAQTEAGGWTKATLAGWGVAWPPQKGWRKKIISEGVPA